MEFQPIASYGFIGNLASCALVNQSGSIDWCCLPHLDSPSVFGAILDPERGGNFRVWPKGQEVSSQQSYIKDTNVLSTEWTTPSGKAEVIDWMHMGGFSENEEDRHRLPAVYRFLRCREGSMTIQVSFNPRLDYGRGRTELSLMEGGVLAESPDDAVSLYARTAFHIDATGAHAAVTLEEGEDLPLICVYGRMPREDLEPPKRSLERTLLFWKQWVGRADLSAFSSTNQSKESVTRSALVLKILAGGHGIAAAATTSLPEILGKGDNWDYRFSWVRDASFTLQALSSIGHLDDAREYLDWVADLLLSEGRRPADLQVLYPLHGAQFLQEEELPHLRGYGDSKPVRIGNAASEQRQLDIFGELLETVFRSKHLHPGVDHVLSGVLRDIVDYVCEVWREPDHGIWELREEPRHYVYSKVMCWVALDRGIRLAEEHGWNVDLARWTEEREAVHALVMEKGFSEERHSFVQSFDSEVLDATALLFPILEFLPPDHPYALSTLDTLQRELAEGPLVYRSSDHHRKEGAFGICSFWLVDALAFAGRLKEAQASFQKLLRLGNHVGLYAEEIDPDTGAFLGNFPQAFTHVGLINSALYLARFEGTAEAEQPLMGEENIP